MHNVKSWKRVLLAEIYAMQLLYKIRMNPTALSKFLPKV